MQGFVKNVARYSIKLRYIQDFDLFVFVLNNFFVFQNEREISPHIVKSLILKLNKQCILRSGQYFHYCSCFRFLRKCACIITLLSVSCQNVLTENSLIFNSFLQTLPCWTLSICFRYIWNEFKCYLVNFFQDANFAINQ